MSAILILPKVFVHQAGTSFIAPLSNANNDLPGMAWIAPTYSSAFVIDLGANVGSYDWVALIGTNLRASDTVAIQTGNATSGTGAYNGGMLPAWSGFKPAASRADAIFKLTSVRTERYLRVDITANTIPGDTVKVFRIVVGKGVVTPGLTYDAEMGFSDQSVVTTGPGYVSVDKYPVLQTWKVPVAWTSETVWKNDLFDLIQGAGNNAGVLFIKDDATPSEWQTDAMYGRVTNNVGGKAVGYNAWSFELQLTSFMA